MNAYKRYKEKQRVEEEVKEEEEAEDEEEEAVVIESPSIQNTSSTATWGEWIANEFWRLLGYSWLCGFEQTGYKKREYFSWNTYSVTTRRQRYIEKQRQEIITATDHRERNNTVIEVVKTEHNGEH